MDLQLVSILLLAVLSAIVSADFPVDDYKLVTKSRDFTGKVVVVTGSSSGIGEGIVRLFSLLGANVTVNGLKAEGVHKPLEVTADLTKSSDLKRVIDETVKTYGKLDVLVNNAGIRTTPTQITHSNLMADWDRLYALDLRAVLEMTHEAAPHLLKTNGTVINISAMGGIAPATFNLIYGPLKSAVNMLTRVLALQLGPMGVRVNTVNPGATQVTEKLDPPVIWEKTRSFVPMKRLGQPLDVAKAVVFLASTDAQYITGANLVVDGGLVYNVGAMNEIQLVSILLLAVLSAIVSADFPVDDYKLVPKSRDFTGKVVVVTGSSSGIGEGIVRLFSLLGANVTVNGLKAEGVHKVALECQQLSPYKLKPLEVTADLTKTADVKRLIDEVIKTYGKIDVLVNNAGLRSVSTLITQSNLMSEWDRLYAIDLRAVVEVTHEAVPHLLKSNGTIINTASMGGKAAMITELAYGPLKAAVDMLTRVLALQLGPSGVRVNAVNPGATQVQEKLDPPVVWEKTRSFTPLKRIGQPLDVAKAVAFLASSDAQFMTGANLFVDGGLVHNMGAMNTMFGDMVVEY
ncbi:unnamed protein product [Medioppia subpectinata]|uniref:Uncharacterized protein n=1 Tax=Medioppia subpectinata TaxID=1979941 RepID=A0A7R9KQJ8_9ACAR|nr:unnamed protein product [Medioppia subpectinata]CAG2107973.1 unnamed protein product [Medioppia subpectinata]